MNFCRQSFDNLHLTILWDNFNIHFFGKLFSKKLDSFSNMKYSSFLEQNTMTKWNNPKFRSPKKRIPPPSNPLSTFLYFSHSIPEIWERSRSPIEFDFSFRQIPRTKWSPSQSKRNDVTHTFFLTYTECLRYWDWTWGYVAICLFLSLFWPLLRWARVFGEAWSLPEVNSS